MSSTYTLNNGIELIGTGEQSGTWGATTNTNFELLDTALDGQVTITAASAGTQGSPNSLPVSDGAASNGRNRLVNITSGTNLGSTVYYQLTPNDAEKIIYIRNSLNTQDLIVFQGTYNASNDYLIPNGKTAIIFFNGGGSGAVAANVMSNAHFDALNIVGDVTIGDDLTLNSDGAIINIGADNDLQITHSGTAGTITNATGDLTLDVAGDIILDADGADFKFRDGGAGFFTISNSSLDAVLKVEQSNEDFIIKGNDGGTEVTALTLDMSSAGFANFNVGGVFNESGADSDFRVESDSRSNMFFVDGGNNTVHINGTNASGGDFNIHRDTASTPVMLALHNDDESASSGAGMAFALTRDGGLIFNNMKIEGFKENDWTGTPSTINGTMKFTVPRQESQIEALRLSSTAAIFNEGSVDRDFRVESDGNTHMLFVDAGNNRLGIGTSAPAAEVHISGSHPHIDLGPQGSNLAKLGFRYDNLYLGATAGGGEVILKNNIGSTDAPDASGDEIARFGDAIVFNEGGRDQDFRVESDGNSHMLFVDAGSNKVSIGSSSFNYGAALTLHANDDGGTPTSLFLRNSGTSSGSGAIIQSGYTSGYGAQIRFTGNPSSSRMSSITFATVTGDSTTQDNLQMSTTGDTIVYNDLGVGHSGNPNYTLDVEAEVSGDWLSQIYNTHTSNGYGLKVRAGDNGDVTSFRVSSQSNANTLLNVYGDGNVSKPNTTCFLGYNTAQQSNIAVSSNVTVVLDAERFDQGSDFGSNVYVAPLDGKYLFSYSVYLKNVDTAAAYNELRLVTSNRVYDTIISPKFTADLTYMVLNGSVIADMETGDQCYLRVVLGGGAAQVDIGTGTWLSGTLIA